MSHIDNFKRRREEFDKRFTWERDPTGCGFLFDNDGQQTVDEVIVKGLFKDFTLSWIDEEIAALEGMKVDVTCQKGCPACDRGLNDRCTYFPQDKGRNEILSDRITTLKAERDSIESL